MKDTTSTRGSHALAVPSETDGQQALREARDLPRVDTEAGNTNPLGLAATSRARRSGKAGQRQSPDGDCLGVRPCGANSTGWGSLPIGTHHIHSDLTPLPQSLGLVAYGADVFEDELEGAAVALADVAAGLEVFAHADLVEGVLGQEGGASSGVRPGQRSGAMGSRGYRRAPETQAGQSAQGRPPERSARVYPG